MHVLRTTKKDFSSARLNSGDVNGVNKIIAGSGINITYTGIESGTGDVTINGVSSSGWGGILGDILNQTDLINYINTRGFITTEIDPIFVSSPAHSITSQNITNWNSAYGWGNHATAGYLKTFTESDPIYTGSSWYNTVNNSNNWNTAYSWGNHATFGYLTSIPPYPYATPTVDGIVSTVAQSFGGVKTYVNEIEVMPQFSGGVKIGRYGIANGIWFNAATPSVSNYGILHDTYGDITTFNGVGGVALRSNGQYHSQVLYKDLKLSVGYGATETPPDYMFSIKGGSLFESKLSVKNLYTNATVAPYGTGQGPTGIYNLLELRGGISNYNYSYGNSNTLYVSGYGGTYAGYGGSANQNTLVLNEVTIELPNSSVVSANESYVSFSSAVNAPASAIIANNFIRSQLVNTGTIGTYIASYLQRAEGNSMPTYYFGILQEDERAKNLFVGKTTFGPSSYSYAPTERVDVLGNMKITGSFNLSNGLGTTSQIISKKADGTMEWIAAPSGGGTSITLGTIGSTPNANAATITGSVLNLQPASASFGGIISTGYQVFAGNKNFIDGLNVSTPTSNLNVSDTVILANSTYLSTTCSLDIAPEDGYTSLSFNYNGGGSSITLDAGSGLQLYSTNKVDVTSKFRLTEIPSSVKSNVLYIDSVTKEITYGPAPSGGSSISGLTTNYIVKATSGTTIGNSQIIDDGTNVGIGITPTSKLQVAGDIKLSGGLSVSNGLGTSGQILSTNGTVNTWVDAPIAGGSVAGNNTEIQYNNNGAFGASSDFAWDNIAKVLNINGDIYSVTGDFKIKQNGFEILRSIASGQNLTLSGGAHSIGISSSGFINSFIYEQGGNGGGINPFKYIASYGSSNLFGLTYTHSNLIITGSPAGNPNLEILVIDNQATGFSNVIALKTISGNVLFGTTSGNVLIGTSTDLGYKLNVAGDIKYSGGLVTSNGLGTNGQILSTNGTINTWIDIPTSGGSAGWGLTGNAGTTSGTNFIGTTDAQPFKIRTNNINRFTVDETGNYLFDTTNATQGRALRFGPNTGQYYWGIRQQPTNTSVSEMFLSGYGDYYPNWTFKFWSGYDNAIMSGIYTFNTYFGYGNSVGSGYLMNLKPSGNLILGGNVTNESSRSLVLMNSTTKGFTKPRMTTVQRDAMTAIISVSISNGGSGYTTPPTVSFTGGGTGATQATGTVNIVGGVVTSITITYGGIYSSTPTIIFDNTGTGGTGAVGTANFTPTEEGTQIYNLTTHTENTFDGTSWRTLAYA